MKIEEMNLEQVNQRLAELDEIVRNATDVKIVNNAATEKRSLIARRNELMELETRRQTALNLTSGEVTGRTVEERRNERPAERTFAVDSVEYRNAWLNSIRGVPVSEPEQRALTGAAYLVPTTTANQVLDKLVDMVPLLEEIELLRVRGNVNFAVNTVAPTVSLKAGGSAVDESTTTMIEVKLSSYTISGLVSIGADIASMAIDAFEGWLTNKLAEQLAYKVELYIIKGSGDSQPTGIDKAHAGAAWVDGTDAVDWAGAALASVDLDKAIGLLPAAYDKNAKFLMSKKTFFKSVIGLKDENNVPLITKEGSVYRIRGYEVKFSDQVDTDDIFFGDIKRGMVGNLSNDIQVERDRNLRYNAWDFLGWCSFDCKPSKVPCIIKIASDIS